LYHAIDHIKASGLEPLISRLIVCSDDEATDGIGMPSVTSPDITCFWAKSCEKPFTREARDLW